jgi:DNA-binding transcriptional MerR regulator
MTDELLSIRQVASRYGVATSALRYYDQRGLVRPASRHGGQRWYGPAELHRLAVIGLGRAIGLGLDEIAKLLDGDRDTWTAVVVQQIDLLEQRIAMATVARAALGHALECPAERPVWQCPSITGLLERWARDPQLRRDDQALRDVLAALTAGTRPGLAAENSSVAPK